MNLQHDRRVLMYSDGIIDKEAWMDPGKEGEKGNKVSINGWG